MFFLSFFDYDDLRNKNKNTLKPKKNKAKFLKIWLVIK